MVMFRYIASYFIEDYDYQVHKKFFINGFYSPYFSGELFNEDLSDGKSYSFYRNSDKY